YAASVWPAQCRAASRPYSGRCLLSGAARGPDFLLSRFRRAGDSHGILPSSVDLGRRTAAVESLQQLWISVPRAMGHDGSLSALADLCPVPDAMVVEFFLHSSFVD